MNKETLRLANYSALVSENWTITVKWLRYIAVFNLCFFVSQLLKIINFIRFAKTLTAGDVVAVRVYVKAWVEKKLTNNFMIDFKKNWCKINNIERNNLKLINVISYSEYIKLNKWLNCKGKILIKFFCFFFQFNIKLFA